MLKVKQLLIWCLLLGALASCGKDRDPEPKTEQDYLPTTAGSTWSYGGTHPYTVTSTGATKVINGKTYFEFETKQGATVNKSYYLKENGVYSGIGFMPSYGDIEMTFLKEGAAVGESWVHRYNMGTFDNVMTLSIAEKNISKTIEGKTYTNVIRISLVTSVSMMDITLPVASSNYYYAKGVGLILSEISTSTQGSQLSTPLISYNIK